MEGHIPISNFGDFEATIVGGKLLLTLKMGIPSGEVKGGLTVDVDTSLLMDAIAKAIPGTIDDAVLNVVKLALKAL